MIVGFRNHRPLSLFPDSDLAWSLSPFEHQHLGHLLRNDLDLPAPRRLALDVKETENGYEIETDVPGVPKENIKVQLDGHLLTISSETKQDDGSTTPNGSRSVKRLRSFSSRSVTLPKRADLSTIQASCADGVLHITLNKLPQDQPTRTLIEVK